MGLAFAAFVNSLVANIMMPIISRDRRQDRVSETSRSRIHHSLFKYGSFLTDLLQFVTIGAAVFFFIVKPVQMVLARRTQRDVEEGMPSDEERRHQELLAALRARG